MKKVTFLFITTVLLINFCCAQSNQPVKQYPSQITCDSTWYPARFISLAEAEKILLRPVHLKDSLCEFKNGYLRYSFTYKATTKDSTAFGKGYASVFFSLEQYAQPAVAKKIYDRIKLENQRVGNTSDLKELGDESFLVKDLENNPFIMIRQNNRIYKLRTVYVTDKGSDSFGALMLLAKKIVAAH